MRAKVVTEINNDIIIQLNNGEAKKEEPRKLWKNIVKTAQVNLHGKASNFTYLPVYSSLTCGLPREHAIAGKFTSNFLAGTTRDFL